jgi:hypothetical protein
MAARRHTAAHVPMTVSCGAAAGDRSYVAGICNKGIAMTARNALAALTAAMMTVGALATPAAALEPLSQERYINDRLIAARIADRIRRECPSLNARVLYAFSQARALERYALDKGYSRKQVDEFLDSKEERKRIYAVAEDYMTRNGVRKGDAESYCRLGRQEIANGTVTGSLLVAK